MVTHRQTLCVAAPPQGTQSALNGVSTQSVGTIRLGKTKPPREFHVRGLLVRYQAVLYQDLVHQALVDQALSLVIFAFTARGLDVENQQKYHGNRYKKNRSDKAEVIGLHRFSL